MGVGGREQAQGGLDHFVLVSSWSAYHHWSIGTKPVVSLHSFCWPAVGTPPQFQVHVDQALPHMWKTAAHAQSCAQSPSSSKHVVLPYICYTWPGSNWRPVSIGPPCLPWHPG